MRNLVRVINQTPVCALEQQWENWFYTARFHFLQLHCEALHLVSKLCFLDASLYKNSNLVGKRAKGRDCTQGERRMWEMPSVLVDFSQAVRKKETEISNIESTERTNKVQNQERDGGVLTRDGLPKPLWDRKRMSMDVYHENVESKDIVTGVYPKNTLWREWEVKNVLVLGESSQEN